MITQNIKPAISNTKYVMPDLRILSRHGLSREHPVFAWIPAFAGMTTMGMFYCWSNKFEETEKAMEGLIYVLQAVL